MGLNLELNRLTNVDADVGRETLYLWIASPTHVPFLTSIPRPTILGHNLVGGSRTRIHCHWLNSRRLSPKIGTQTDNHYSKCQHSGATERHGYEPLHSHLVNQLTGET